MIVLTRFESGGDMNPNPDINDVLRRFNRDTASPGANRKRKSSELGDVFQVRDKEESRLYRSKATLTLALGCGSQSYQVPRGT
jgi:hypothetical protein